MGKDCKQPNEASVKRCFDMERKKASINKAAGGISLSTHNQMTSEGVSWC